jgi:uncharacterized protein
MQRCNDRSISRFGLAAITLALATCAPVHAQLLPVPQNHVEDRARILSAQAFAQLDTMLTKLEQSTSAQIILLTVDTTGGLPIDDFAQQHFESWKLGQAGKDNGALIVIAVKDRKMRIEVGYGLEPALPDAFCSRILREDFTPNFRKGDYEGGLIAGVSRIVNKAAGSEMVEAPQPQRRATRGKIGRLAPLIPCCVLLFIFGLMFLMAAAGSRQRGYQSWGGGVPWWVWWLMMNQAGGRRRGRRRRSGWEDWSGHWGGWTGGGSAGGWGRGSGGWGGGGGSFGGGGGGSFGGGGASGGW